MRRGSFVACLTVAAIAWTTSAAWGLYTPNPAARWPAERFFLAGDFQFNADKDLDPRGDLEEVTGLFVRPGFSIAENVVAYARLGFQTADDLDTGFAGGFGIQGAYVLPRAPEWAIGGAFDFLYWDTETDRGGFEVDVIEYQFTPAVSYRVPQAPLFNPYAGMMIDFLDGDVDEGDTVGLLLGSNFDVARNVRLDAQIRLVSETGIFLSAAYVF